MACSGGLTESLIFHLNRFSFFLIHAIYPLVSEPPRPFSFAGRRCLAVSQCHFPWYGAFKRELWMGYGWVIFGDLPLIPSWIGIHRLDFRRLPGPVLILPEAHFPEQRLVIEPKAFTDQYKLLTLTIFLSRK